MAHLMESMFDVAYLGLVIALGIRLLLESGRDARVYGAMAVVLGLGDAFHLLPRVVSHLTVDGFERYLRALSYGEMVTSLSMTAFYLLFFSYYRSLSGDRDRRKAMLVYALAAARVILVALPQNRWGTEGSYLFSLLRNVPFAILGLLLILWTWRYRRQEGLRHTSLLIAASFLFYLPVVVGARFVPLLGALMIPKTVAYVLLVAVGYRHFIRGFCAENLLRLAAVFLLLGLAGGVFYREFTRYFGWTAYTSLSVVHVHLLALGFVLCLLLHALLRQQEARLPAMKAPVLVFVTGLGWTVTAFMVRGIYAVTSQGAALLPSAALSGLAGLGHLLLGAGLVWLTLRLVRPKPAA